MEKYWYRRCTKKNSKYKKEETNSIRNKEKDSTSSEISTTDKTSKEDKMKKKTE